MALRYNPSTGAFEDDGLVAQGMPAPSGSWNFSAPGDAGMPAPAPAPEPNPYAGSFGIVQQPIAGGQPPEIANARAGFEAQTLSQGGGVGVDLAEPQNLGAASNPEGGRLGVNDFLALANQGGGGGGGPRVTQTIRQEMPLGPQTPEQQAQYDALAQERAGIEERRTEAEEALKDVTVDREALKSKEFDQYRQKIDSFNEEMTQKQQKMQGISNGLEGAYKQKREEVKNAQIDPDQFWKEKGTLGRMLGAIAIGMGQFGASMTGSRNAALDIVNDAINRNIQAQLQKIQTGKEDLGQAKEDYLNQLNRTDQIEAKTSLIKDQMYTDYIRRLDAQLSVTEDQEARGKLELMIQDADEARNAASQQSLQKIMGNVVVEKKQVSGGGGRSAGAKLKAVNQALDAAKKYKEITEGKGKGGDTKTLVPGIGYAPSQKGAEVVKGTIEYGATSIAALKRLRDMAENAGPGSTFMATVPGGDKFSSDVAGGGTLAESTGIAIAKARDPSTGIRKSEEESIKKQVPNPYAIGKDAAIAKYNQLEQEMRTKVRNVASSQGLDPDDAERQLEENIRRSGSNVGSQGYGFGQ